MTKTPSSLSFHSGDILAFYGRGFVSSMIEIFTRGPSHVAILAGHPDDAHRPEGRILVWESTSLCTLPDLLSGKTKAGVQVHPIRERIGSYEGDVYHLPLMPSWRLDFHEWSLLTRFLNHHHSEGYDFEGAGLSGTRALKFLRNRYPDENSAFCSELCAVALMRVGRLPISNSSLFNPANLVRALRSAGTHGTPIPLKSGKP